MGSNPIEGSLYTLNKYALVAQEEEQLVLTTSVKSENLSLELMKSILIP